MKTAKLIAKILVAAAAVAGVVYVIATYGNQIVAWCKKLLASLPCCKGEACEACEVEAAEEAAEEAVEEVVEAVEEVPLPRKSSLKKPMWQKTRISKLNFSITQKTPGAVRSGSFHLVIEWSAAP